MSADLWYLAYGSNLQPALLARYIAGSPTARPTRWVDLAHRLYFAGDSRRWHGPVAFVSLNRSPHLPTTCRAIAVATPELQKIFRSENGLGANIGCVLETLEVGQWVEVLMRRPEDPRQGKYNAILRGSDIEGRPSFTFTTARRLDLGTPAQGYLDAIQVSLEDERGTDWATDYLAKRTGEASGDNLTFLPRNRPGPSWSGHLRQGRFSGYPAVRLDASLSPVAGARNFLGTVSVGAGTAEVWIDFGFDGINGAEVTSSVARALGLDGAMGEGIVAIDDVYLPTRLSGRLDDISVSDVVQVHPDHELAHQRWALVVTQDVSAPVRVQVRDHVPTGKVRVAYALRVLLHLGREDAFALQAIEPVEPAIRVRRVVRWAMETTLGAPTVALRATEGLVGDDGKMVVRADAAALDFVGIQAGQEAVLSWADRAAVVRVLLQTSETVETMQAQLAESTGKQLRISGGDPTARTTTPLHLRVWVSSTVRHSLGIPPDTVVRLRRSIPHKLLRSTSQAAVPGVGILIAAAALELPWWLWVIAGALLIVLVALPLRVKPR